ncbi:hypothetical protein AAG570_005360 [Ranatra chinensis]|uniref:Uncharacterized protein n=1 Tax=Ranatra chinensis TaxID=642074 RepID=A0ABD0Y0A9_9HEMI
MGGVPGGRRWTFLFWSRVEYTLSSEWLSPGYNDTQIISGHGNFVAKLADFGLKDQDNCVCGVPETVGHFLLESGKYGDLRGEYVRKVGGLKLDRMLGNEGNENSALLVTEILGRNELRGVERPDIIDYSSLEWLGHS